MKRNIWKRYFEKDLILKNYLTNKKLKDKILEFKDWTFLNKKVTNLKFFESNP